MANPFRNTVQHSLLYLALIAGVLFTGLQAFAQATPGSEMTRRSSGMQSVFSYRITTTYGTSTSAQVSGNMRADTEATLKLKSGSIVTNKMGDAGGNTSAVFIATPTGGNVDLKGITGENKFLLEDGTSFRSHLSTIDNPDPTLTSSGSASATATHSTTITVEKGSSSFENVFRQTF